MRLRKGFTLIEMLVSLVILSSVMVLSSEAYRFFVVQLNQRQDSFVTEFEQFKRLKWLQHQIAATEMYYVTAFDGTKKLFFSGNEQALMWVSATSVAKPGMGAISGLVINDGQLQYCETSLENILLIKVNMSQQDLCKSFVLPIVPASELSLQYYGWSDLNAQLSQDALAGSANVASWQSKYNGHETGTLPSVIRMTLKRDSISQEYWIQLYGLNPAKAGYFSNANSG